MFFIIYTISKNIKYIVIRKCKKKTTIWKKQYLKFLIILQNYMTIMNRKQLQCHNSRGKRWEDKSINSKQNL